MYQKTLFKAFSHYQYLNHMLLRCEAMPGTLKGTLGVCDLMSSQQQCYLLRTVKNLHTSPHMLLEIPQENS